MKIPLCAAFVLCCAVSPALHADEAAFSSLQPLLGDANSFAGFHQLGGKAQYEIKDSVITGTSVPKDPNSFMATEKEYGDFALEYEFKIDPKLNSGVQIRSHSRPEYRKGQVHGYQIEIDPSARAWTAGLYEEGRRGWLQDLKGSDAARAAFKQGDWNRVRVLAVGDSIKTWLNGVPATDARDAMEQGGFIAFQVHGVGNDADKVGTQVQWREIKLADLGRHEWQPLFDGTSLQGWNTLPGGKWEVKDGVIHGTSTADEPRHGLLISEQPYRDFTVRLKFKVNTGNSGFYFRAQKVDSAVAVHGFQAEICGDDETGGLYETGGRGWVAQTDKEAMTKNKIYRPGEWNELWVSAHGKRLVAHVNGHKTADITDEAQTRAEGYIALQLHDKQDMDVEFKDIALLVPVKEKK